MEAKFLNKDALELLLGSVEKPSRYTGGELNMTLKRDANVKFAL